MQQTPRLPSAWVDRLFDRLAVRYGTQFARQYDGLDIAAVKADWAEELAGFRTAPEALEYALNHADPDRAPNASQFRALARMAPRIEKPTLPPPPADPEKVDRLMAEGRLAAATARGPGTPAEAALAGIVQRGRQFGLSRSQREFAATCRRMIAAEHPLHAELDSLGVSA